MSKSLFGKVRGLGLKKPSLLLFHAQQPHVGRFCGVASSVLTAFLPERAIGDRSSVCARTSERFNPHLYQTGSNSPRRGGGHASLF